MATNDPMVYYLFFARPVGALLLFARKIPKKSIHLLVMLALCLLGNHAAYAQKPHAANPKADRVIVNKSLQVLYLMKNGKVLSEFHVVFGTHSKGDKVQEGDGRTPEGNYTLDAKNPHSHYYKSIHISYPNAKDRKEAARRGVNPGGSIMIHGQKNGYEWLSFLSKYVNWTKGCIALSNEDMDEVWKSVRVGTPIEIRP